MPTNSEILNALGTGSNCLRTHKNLQVVKRPNGEYFFSTGNFSLVVKMFDPVESKYYAVKCFTQIHPKLIESYVLIGKHIQMNQSPYLVHYEFCDNEIWINSEVDAKKGYPVIIMEWIEGKTLGSHLSELVSNGDKETLFQLACNFDALSLWLLEQPFAHGDLKTDNILIDSSGRLRLIDYDGMFTPEMKNQQARENGSLGFRHPNRLTEHFGPHIDDFSILLISLSLHALATAPYIAGTCNSFSDSILFTEDDIINIEHSIWKTFDTLRNNIHVSQRIVMFQMAAANPATMRLFGIKPILQSAASLALLISDNDEFTDEDIKMDKYAEKDSRGINKVVFYKKSTGKIIFDEYDDSTGFIKGLAGVKLNDKWGYIDKTGKFIVPLIYDDAKYFSEGLAGVKLNDKWGYIDKKGKVIAPLIYDIVGTFQEGLGLVKLNDKYGFLNKSGKIAILTIYGSTDNFSEGFTWVKNSFDNKYGFIDKLGKVAIPFIYETANKFSEGLASVKLNGKYGFINNSGKVAIPFIYDDAFIFLEGLAKVKFNNKYGSIDKSGRLIIRFLFDSLETFSEGLASVGINNKYGFIDKRGNVVIPLIYDSVNPFSAGSAWVERDDGYGTMIGEIDNTGKVVNFRNAPDSLFDEGVCFDMYDDH